jgi:hypothetical protein
MEEEYYPQLTTVGEKSLPAKCKPSTLAYCPSMDLIALATEDDELRVFRLNGQRVFGGSFKGDPHLGEDEADGEVRALAWKGNGMCDVSGEQLPVAVLLDPGTENVNRLSPRSSFEPNR